MHRFPAYLKTADGKHFFRVESAAAFTEVQLIGQRAVIHRVTDAAYPEQVRIVEMLALEGGRYLPIAEQEFLKMLDQHNGR